MTFLIQPLNKLRASGIADKPWFNAVWFQLTWFSCVLGREPWLMASCTLIALHFILVPSAKNEAYNLAPIIAVGIAVDALLSTAGVFDFGPVLLPLWLCLLWIAFATTLTRALSFFSAKPLLAAVIGGIGVPFNYAVGAQLGAVELPLEPSVTAVSLIVVWTVLFPSLYRVSQHRLSGAC